MRPLRSRVPRSAAVTAATAVLIALTAIAAGAQDQALTPVEVDAEASKIFHSVMSPYCPGVLLSGCGSSRAVALRDSIKSRLRRGRTREQIMDDLLAVYGEDILGMPSYTGTGGLVWLLPGLALVFGLGGAYWWVRQNRQPRQNRQAPPAPAPPVPADDALRRKLQAELKERA